MAKISTYAIDATPTLKDKVIGTDVNDSNITKNYTLGDIISLVPPIPSVVTDLYIPISNGTDYVDSAITQDSTTVPTRLLFSTLLFQQNLGGSTYLGDKSGVVDTFVGEGSGNFNVGIGFESLSEFTSGANPVSGAASAGENVALGYRALKSTTQGTNNIAIGADSLNANTIGYNNVAISKNALGSVVNSQQSIINNEYTIGIGFAAGNPSSTQVTPLEGHIGSTMVGHQAMADIVYDTTTFRPFNNVAIGLRTLRQTGTATNPSSLYDNTSIGAFAGFRARLDTNGTTGSPTTVVLNENIFIGKNAGYDIRAAALGTAPSGMTLGQVSNNTFIGGTSIPKYVASGNVVIETGGIGNTLGAQSATTNNNAAATNLLITGNTQVIGSSNIILNPLVADSSEFGIKNTIGQAGTGNDNKFTAHNIILSNRYPGEYGGSDDNTIGQDNKITVTNNGVLDAAKLRNNMIIGSTGATLNADSPNNNRGLRDNTIINGQDIDVLTTQLKQSNANTVINSKFLTISGADNNFVMNTRGSSETDRFVLESNNTNTGCDGNFVYNASNPSGTTRSSIIGENNFIMNSQQATILGDLNTVLGSKGTISGSNNLMHGNQGTVINGSNHFVFGQNNEIRTNAFGTSTRVGVIGFNNNVENGVNNINSNNTFVGGSNNEVAGSSNSFIFGQSLISTKKNSTIIGKFNEDDGAIGTPLALFQVGCGVNDSNRKNALQVRGAGSNTFVFMDQMISQNFADDVAAKAGGVDLGALYHTNGVVKIQYTQA